MEDLERRFRAWAVRQPEILAVIVVGSHARRIPPSDELSDLDLVVFATDLDKFMSDDTWLGEIGPVLAHHCKLEAVLPEWFAIFGDGLKLDVAFVHNPVGSSRPTLPELLESFPFPDVLQRGVRILLDPTGGEGEPIKLPETGLESAPLPDSRVFSNHIFGCWFAVHRVIKFTQRGDLWRAVSVCNCELKEMLLVLLEWRARILHPDIFTWYGGRFLSEWTDEDILAELPATFAHFDAQDLHHAALASYDLVNRIGVEIANRLGYDFPAGAEQKMRAFLVRT